ncbi:hypothetical protein [Paenibacillus alkalitolerans]|uniref:hypothetical protein n=1 Tax=Paenibacillus alkalitolerans TaxID=2799335 RepID=UPI0018F34E45|nr:hypothetical protein [Paenibacillus alkalitolerans]
MIYVLALLPHIDIESVLYAAGRSMIRMVVLMLSTIGLIVFVAAVCMLITKAIHADSWSQDAYNVWIGVDVSKCKED